MLEKDQDALAEITIFLYRREEGKQDILVNSLEKNKTRRKMRMNVQIDEYVVASVILDLESYSFF